MACMDILKSALLAVIFVIYLVFGAFVFQRLEKEAEDTAKSNTYLHRLDFLKNYTCLTHEALDQLVNVIGDAVKQGINPLANSTENSHTNWDFSSSFFLSGTVVTTIGYGTIAPRTAGGQIFCVFYALFGIPLNVIVLSQVGKKLSTWCKKLGKCLFSRGVKKKTAKILTIIFFLVIGSIVFMTIPPFVFSFTEGWSYQEGIYYAFISLSTIGFGDYVVGYESNSHRMFPFFRVLVCFWIMFGLAWLSLLINLLTSLLEDTEKKIVKNFHKKVKQHKAHEETHLEPVHTDPEDAKVLIMDNGKSSSRRSKMSDNDTSEV
ncbi:potassium channel subfamily K member 16-like [Pelobates cultripes]|uniref:Potassium channel subfamily K member n=1 Tax=Pelobates cultripes TaxID=61616 RepID=A0AAD1TP43_PELCU|nr:potassium channel subfamily K member 16-like [Pelobates cultripes]